MTADGLQARYIDQSKLDLPAITASARYRFCGYNKFFINSINDNSRKKETQDVSAQNMVMDFGGHAVEISEIYILEHCVPRSYLNIAQYEEVDSDEESVTNKFTRSVGFLYQILVFLRNYKNSKLITFFFQDNFSRNNEGKNLGFQIGPDLKQQ